MRCKVVAAKIRAAARILIDFKVHARRVWLTTGVQEKRGYREEHSLVDLVRVEGDVTLAVVQTKTMIS